MSDMGLSEGITNGPGADRKHGTCGYWPPEVINSEPYTTEPDWWALSACCSKS